MSEEPRFVTPMERRELKIAALERELAQARAEVEQYRQDAERWRAHMAGEDYLLEQRRDNPCPECRGIGSVGFMQLRCRTCDGTGIDPFGKPMKEGT